VRWLIATALTLFAAAALAARRNASDSGETFHLAGFDMPVDPDAFMPDQLPTPFESLAVAIDPSTYNTAAVDDSTAARNIRAMLDTIAWAEGANYNTLFGGGTFSDYTDHPRQFIRRRLGGRWITSSAAGRYQFLARTWDGLKMKLQLPDFSPASQDLGAIELIRERGALEDVKAGRIAMAIEKVRKVWASLPGAGYNQPEKSFAQLVQVYQQAGGAVESQA
jgi:muramidase (phage lysozyme)